MARAFSRFWVQRRAPPLRLHALVDMKIGYLSSAPTPFTLLPHPCSCTQTTTHNPQPTTTSDTLACVFFLFFFIFLTKKIEKNKKNFYPNVCLPTPSQ